MTLKRPGKEQGAPDGAPFEVFQEEILSSAHDPARKPVPLFGIMRQAAADFLAVGTEAMVFKICEAIW